MANTWVQEEAVRQVADNGLVHYSGTQRLAESCLRAGNAHGYRRGLQEAARIAPKHVAHGQLEPLLDELCALADARADSGQGN